MNQVYEPLKDPAADGYTFVGVAVDPAIEQALAPSKQDWKATSQSALSGANAAPDATPAQSSSFWRWFKWGAVALFLGICWLAYSQHQAYKAEVTKIQSTPSGSPEIGASPIAKAAPNVKNSATNNIATQAINTTDTDGFYGLKAPEFKQEKPAKKPRIPDDFTVEFDKQVLNFESKI